MTSVCPAGYICLGNGYQVSCNVLDLLSTNPLAVLTYGGTTAAQLVYGKGMPAGGLYCPGTIAAGPCPAGSYCPDPLTALTCPRKHFCPTQSAAPLPCSWLFHCPAGSAAPSLTWGAFLGVLLLVLSALLLCRAALAWQQRHRVKLLQQGRESVASARQQAEAQPTGCELARMPTLASVHSNQAVMDVRMTVPLEQAPDEQPVPFLAAELLLSHSQLHLLLCPWQSSLQRLLQALAGCHSAIYKSGMVYHNQEVATSHAHQNLVALLPWEDPLEETLTVVQNLQLSAHLCLPPHFTPHRKASLIQEVLDLLALGPLQHCLVGSPAAPGALSACERKLAAIATKLVTCPALLLLQQPFQACHLPSDSLAAQHLLSSLQTAAQKLRINIVVGEESLPNRVYKRFPHAVLLDQAGLQVFAGEPQQAASWFHHLGFTDTHSCPVSFCTSTILGQSNSSGDTHTTGLPQLWAIQGKSWLQLQQAMPPPALAHQPAQDTRLQIQQPPGQDNWSAFAAANGTTQAGLQHQAGHVWGAVPYSASEAHLEAAALHPQQQPPTALQAISKGLSGNPFAPPSTSLDTAAPSDIDTGQSQGMLVPPLALHKLPSRFGPGVVRDLSPKSRFAALQSDPLGASFTSASLSYSEIPSTGYTTRVASPEPGLRDSVLRAAQSPVPSQDDPTLAVSNPLFGCTPQRGNSPDFVRCDSEDYGAVNPLYSNPALVRPALLKPGPVCEGIEDDTDDLHQALARQGFSLHSSRGSDVSDQQMHEDGKPASRGAWSKLTSLWSGPEGWLRKRKRPEEEEEEPQQADHGSLQTDQITIDVPSFRCSPVSQRQQMADEGDCTLPLPPLQTSSSPPESPTRRLTKQASNAASAVLVAISDASPIPRSPKPGPVPHRSWFVDASPRRSSSDSLRQSPPAWHHLLPVSTALKQRLAHQLLHLHCLDAIIAAAVALLLGMLHGPGWQLQQLPVASLPIILGLGITTALAALPAFRVRPAVSIAAVHSPALHLCATALIQAIIAVLRSALFGGIYSSLVLPSLPFGSLYLVLLLVCCWCAALAALLAHILPSRQAAAGALAVLIALGGNLSGVFPTLRQLHPTPWFLVSGLSLTRWAAEALTIEQFRSAATSLRPVGLQALSQHGYCGLHGIVYWDTGAYITQEAANSLLTLIEQGGNMCSSYIHRDLIALAAQAGILLVCAGLCLMIKVYLFKRLSA